MKGLFYCQSFVAVAPLIRSLLLCKSLVKDFDIDFLYGGQQADIAYDLPRFRFIQLPHIPTNRYDDFILELPSDERELKEIFSNRWKAIEDYLQGPYDFFITELFPFAKLNFATEIIHIIQEVKKENPHCLILSSVRDVLDLFSFRFPKIIKKLIDHYYDYVLVHSDPTIIKLNDTFPAAEKIKNKIIYTGFVPNLTTNTSTVVERRKEILIMIGGGSFGGVLLKAVARTAPYFPDYQFIFVLGPHSPQKFKLELEVLQKISGCSNIIISPFLKNIEQALRSCALSISLGGYTLIDVISTRTPSIVFPMAYTDQLWRTTRFAFLGLVRKITYAELYPEKLAPIIKETLCAPYPTYPININGAENTRSELKRILSQPDRKNRQNSGD